MQGILRWVGNILAFAGATLAGNWLGGQLRFILTGERVQTIQFRYTTQKGNTIANSPVATKFYPGMLFSLVGKPRWFFALVGGMLAGALIPDYFENVWVERVIEPLIVERVMGAKTLIDNIEIG